MASWRLGRQTLLVQDALEICIRSLSGHTGVRLSGPRSGVVPVGAPAVGSSGHQEGIDLPRMHPAATTMFDAAVH